MYGFNPAFQNSITITMGETPFRKNLGYGFTKSLHQYTIDWLNVIPSIPADRVIAAVNTFIVSCVNDGSWDLIDRCWLLGQDKRQNAMYSIANPTSVPMVEVRSTFIKDKGITTNNSTNQPGFINTMTDLSTLTNWQQNSAFYGMYINSFRSSSSSTVIFGVTDGTNIFRAFMNTNSNNIGNFVINGTVSAGVGNTQTRGVWTGFRTGATTWGEQTPTATANPSIASTGVPTGQNLYLLGNNNNGTFTSPTAVLKSQEADVISLYLLGGGGINNANMRTKINTLVNDLGWNIAVNGYAGKTGGNENGLIVI
jgi:hypothetical protein